MFSRCKKSFLFTLYSLHAGSTLPRYSPTLSQQHNCNVERQILLAHTISTLHEAPRSPKLLEKTETLTGILLDHCKKHKSFEHVDRAGGRFLFSPCFDHDGPVAVHLHNRTGKQKIHRGISQVEDSWRHDSGSPYSLLQIFVV